MCLGLVDNLAEFYPEAKWQRCIVHFYRNVWTAVPTGKVKGVAAMLKATHAQEDAQSASTGQNAMSLCLRLAWVCFE
jgi:transposase-like protein